MQPGQPGEPYGSNAGGSAGGQPLLPAPAQSSRFDEPLPTLPDMAPPSGSGQMNLAALVSRPSAPPAGRMPTTGQMPAVSAPSGVPGAVSAPPGASLGVRSAMLAHTAARMAAVVQGSRPEAEGAVGPREPTLTARMRAVQPPDVARQAISELGVLARELATLPDALEESGLARTHRDSYFEATEDYLRLARIAWESVAEERLEQSGADAEYRQRAILVARRVSQLQQECRSAIENAEFQLPRHTPPLWRRRVGLVRTGLRAWQERLAPTPDPLRMGRGLFVLRGYFGLATAGGLEMLLLDLLMGTTIALLAVFGIGMALLLAGAIAAGSAATLTVGLGAATVATFGALALVVVLGARGPAPLGRLLGAAVFSATRSTRNLDTGTALLGGLLRAWWQLVGVVAVVGLFAALAAGGVLLGSTGLLVQPGGTTAALTFAGGVAALASGLAATVSLAALVLLGVPTLLAALLRFATELGGSPTWVPAARRYALRPALVVLAALSGALLLGGWIATNALVWRGSVFTSFSFGSVALAVTTRGVLLLAALVVPYLLLLELPFRVGMRRWRHAWLADLAVRRADVESHVRRLSATDPRSGAQDTGDDNLRAMQYDLVLLQFYRDKIAEAGKTAAAPIGLARAFVALVLAAATALALDNAVVLIHALVK
jgi:hypothetical protein